MRIRTILTAAAAPAALAAILLGTAGQASAAVTAQGPTAAVLTASQKAEGTVRLIQHPDTDFQGSFWALDDVTHHQVVTGVVQAQDGTYSYDVTYDEQGTFTTNADLYHSHLQGDIPIANGAHGVMNGTGSVHVTGASQVPDMKYLKSLGNPAHISDVLAPGGGTIDPWHYTYNYKIPGTDFSAVQSDVLANNVP
jgi:hypothetical protein